MLSRRATKDVAVSRWCNANDRHRDRELDAPDRRDSGSSIRRSPRHPLPWSARGHDREVLREAQRRTDWIGSTRRTKPNASLRRAILADDTSRRSRSYGRIARRTRTGQRTRTGCAAHAVPGVPTRIRAASCGPEPGRPRQPTSGDWESEGGPSGKSRTSAWRTCGPITVPTAGQSSP